MFNDERINLEVGKILKRCIIFSIIITLIVGTVRAICYSYIIELFIYAILPECVIFLCGILIILGDIIFIGKNKDERILYIKSKYYKIAFWFFISSILCGYSLSIPFYYIKSIFSLMDPPYYGVVFCLLYLCSIYFIYSFKKKGIYFNYSFIEQDYKKYYFNVLKNVLKLVVIILPSCLIGWVITRYFEVHYKIQGNLHSLVLFVILFLLLTILYCLFSVIEKQSFESQETESSLDKGIRLLFICNLCVFLVFNLIQPIYYLYYASQESNTSEAFYNIILFITASSEIMGALWAVTSSASLCYLLNNKKCGNFMKYTAVALIVTEALERFIGIFSELYNQLPPEKVAQILNKYITPFNLSLSWIQCAIVLLFFIAVYKEYKLKIIILVTPILNIIGVCAPRICGKIAQSLLYENIYYAEKQKFFFIEIAVGRFLQTIVLFVAYVFAIHILTKCINKQNVDVS